MTQPHHRNRHPKYRKKYKVHNWRSCEQSLINRGNLTLWLSEDVIKSWNSDLDQRIGRPKLYSDLDIETENSHFSKGEVCHRLQYFE